MGSIEYHWVDEDGSDALHPGAILFTSFPSAGLAATVAAHYMIRTLNLPRVGLLDSRDSAPIAVIQAGRVNPPVRVYGRPKFGIVVSEFPPTPAAAGPIAEAILATARARQCRMVVCLEGVVPHPVDAEPTEGAAQSVWVVTSRPDAAFLKSFEAAGAKSLDDGIIGGVTGALLIAGLRSTIPVAALLVSAQGPEGFPDNRAGAALIEMLDRYLPELGIDTKPLVTQAEVIERALRAAMRNRPKSDGEEPGATPPAPPIYQ
jgi:predicted ATP-grasp superfamily ATP-dependent carboligase